MNEQEKEIFDVRVRAMKMNCNISTISDEAILAWLAIAKQVHGFPDPFGRIMLGPNLIKHFIKQASSGKSANLKNEFIEKEEATV